MRAGGRDSVPGSAAETGAAACRPLARRRRQEATAAVPDAEAATCRLATAPTRARIATSHAMDAPTWPHRPAAPSVPDVRITRDRTAQMTASPARYEIPAHRR